VRYAMEELSQWKFTGLRLSPTWWSARRPGPRVWTPHYVIPAERSESRDPPLRACRRGDLGPGSPTQVGYSRLGHL